MEFISVGIVCGLWKTKEISWKELSARGAFGGILVIRNDCLLNREVVLGECSISCLFEDCRNRWRCVFIVVYSRGERQRERFVVEGFGGL